MKFKSLLTLGLLASALFLNSCSKDDASPKLQLVADGDTYTLKGANLYLTRGSSYNGHNYRDYIISDGTLINGNDGWGLEDYTGATYYLAVEISSPSGETLTTGSFPQYYDWSSVPAESGMSYVYMESGTGNDYFYFETPEATDEAPVTVTGGLEDGNKMTLKFNGTLYYYYFDGVNWVDKTVSGKFYFSAKVQDKRPAL